MDDDKGLIAKLNQRLITEKAKAREVYNLEKKLEEYIETNKGKLEESYNAIQSRLSKLQKKISYLEGKAYELNNTNRVTEIITQTVLKRKTSFVHGRIDKEDYYAHAPFAADARITNDRFSFSAIQERIPMQYMQEALGGDLESFVDKKIPVKVYRYGELVIHAEKIDKSPERVVRNNISINKLPGIRAWCREAAEKCKSEIIKIEADKETWEEKSKRGYYSLEIGQMGQDIERLMKEYNPHAMELIKNFFDFNKSGGISVAKKPIRDADCNMLDGYVLCMNDNPVARWMQNNWCSIAYSHSRAKPMKIEIIKLDIDDKAKELFEFKPGDYLTISQKLKVLDSETLDIFYDKINNGITILPYEQNKEGYKIKRARGEFRKTPPPQPRHWGQEYLGKLVTGEIVEGEFFATGFTYQAFPVKKLMVVEANEEGRATYVFRKNHFDDLRVFSRRKLISEEPEGYVGRIMHTGEKEEWKKRLTKTLKKAHVNPVSQKKAYKYSFIVER